MLEKQWKTINGEKVDDLVGLLRVILADTAKIVHIGTDSMQVKRGTEYVTVVVVLTPGKGGRAFYVRERVPKIRSMRERLVREAWISTTLAMELTATPDVGVAAPIVGDLDNLLVHVDANPDERHMSSNFVQEMVGMVVGQGFRVVFKPDSWCATHAADHVVRQCAAGMR